MDAETILDAALAVAAERGWRQATLTDIAAHAGCGLADVYRHFPSRGALARAAVARVDAAVLSETDTWRRGVLPGPALRPADAPI